MNPTLNFQFNSLMKHLLEILFSKNYLQDIRLNRNLIRAILFFKKGIIQATSEVMGGEQKTSGKQQGREVLHTVEDSYKITDLCSPAEIQTLQL